MVGVRSALFVCPRGVWRFVLRGFSRARLWHRWLLRGGGEGFGGGLSVVPAARAREVKVLLEDGGFLAGKIRRVGGSGGCRIPTSLVGGSPTSTSTTASTSDNGDDGDDEDDGDGDGDANFDDEEKERIFQRLGIQDGHGITITTVTATCADTHSGRKTDPPENPLQAAITTFLTTNPPEDPTILLALLSTLPKRYTYTPPLLLLPSTAFSTPVWQTYLRSLPHELRQKFYSTLASAVCKNATHLALLRPIPTQNNAIRAPKLTPLFGTFPPLLPPQQQPTRSDLDGALWTSTRQSGIVQIWAPGYTMFSRGNVKEKARILRFPPPTTGVETGTGTKWAVDMYAGIGYFAFPYAKLGYRVLAWEINHWSVEGLLRGAGENDILARVVLPQQDARVAVEREGVLVFLEDNENAPARIAKMGEGVRGAIERVNLGLLPTSRGSWGGAVRVLAERGGWVHVHENVGIGEIDVMAGEVVRAFEGLEKERGGRRRVVCEHVERVKTFAPGVMHCVFDIRIGEEEL
ncbi:S-adenosyl-L-methionine-dependent methyltransferase [Tuber brumale]|nr:S-adenosyl-L-methionine-dependent methyltransferase [Tuber brumale]